ncbi:MAG: glycosyltransferase [Longimicrobiaceae bacterium]
MKTSVIVSTYNQPAWLKKVLYGYAVQSVRGFELIVADDGSGAETRAVIERVCGETGLEVLHLSHQDRGYRRSVILNRATLAAGGEYLIFTDGDCVPRSDFVARHQELARPGRFLSGGAVMIPLETSRAISKDDVTTGRFARAGWLGAHGWWPGRHFLRLLEAGPLPKLLDRMTTTRASWNLNNSSTWREAVLEANGMDNEMTYGGADRALGERLERLGLRGIQARHRLVCVHLDHGRPYRTCGSVVKNKRNRASQRRSGSVRAPSGISQLGHDPGFTRELVRGGEVVA